MRQRGIFADVQRRQLVTVAVKLRQRCIYTNVQFRQVVIAAVELRQRRIYTNVQFRQLVTVAIQICQAGKVFNALQTGNSLLRTVHLRHRRQFARREAAAVVGIVLRHKRTEIVVREMRGVHGHFASGRLGRHCRRLRRGGRLGRLHLRRHAGCWQNLALRRDCVGGRRVGGQHRKGQQQTYGLFHCGFLLLVFVAFVIEYTFRYLLL